MKVLATHRYPGPAFDELGDVEVQALAELKSPRPEVEALVVANEPVPLDLLPGLRLVANFSVGYDRIDLEELTRRDIAVTNTPGVLSAATADLTLGLILATRRRVAEGDALVRAGEWRSEWANGIVAEELTGSTLGIVGLGRIGQAVARRAQGFELRVLYAQRTRGVTAHASSTRRAARSLTRPRSSRSSSRDACARVSTSSRTSRTFRPSCCRSRTSSSRRTSAAQRARRAKR